mgnify:CR=1 FL=1
MEIFLILIHIVLFSSDNLDPFQSLVHKQNIENIQTEYMLFLHRLSQKSNLKDNWNLAEYTVHPQTEPGSSEQSFDIESL